MAASTASTQDPAFSESVLLTGRCSSPIAGTFEETATASARAGRIFVDMGILQSRPRRRMGDARDATFLSFLRGGLLLGIRRHFKEIARTAL